MELGLTGRRAIICASSRGLGFACADSLAREGAHVVLNGRDAAALEAAVAELAERHGVEVAGVVGDIADEGTRSALLDAVSYTHLTLPTTSRV